jgi:hypothetical protein
MIALVIFVKIKNNAFYCISLANSLFAYAIIIAINVWECVMLLRILLCLAMIVAAKGQKVTVEFVNGQAEIQKKGMGDWKVLRVGKKLKEKDRIRTFVASQVVLKFVNGTEIKLEENTVLRLSELFDEVNQSKTNLDVSSGQILFKVKKLAGEQSSFRFETPTATAAIRGTEGGIGIKGNKTIAFLDEGKLKIVSRNTGQSVLISASEILLETEEGFGVQRLTTKALKASDIFKNIIKDTSTTEINLRNIEENILKKVKEILIERGIVIDSGEIKSKGSTHIDSVVVEIPAQLGSINPWPKEVYENYLTLSGSCLNSKAVRLGQNRVSVDQTGLWSLNLEWEKITEQTEDVEKNYMVWCIQDDQEVFVSNVKFIYKAGAGNVEFLLDQGPSVKPDNGVVKLTGSYKGPEARIELRVKDLRQEIKLANGRFDVQFVVQDKLDNWDASSFEIYIKTLSEELHYPIQLEVDFADLKINTLSPKLIAKLDELRGEIIIGLDGSEIDPLQVSLEVDDVEVESKEINRIVHGFKFGLHPGNHNYRVIAKDLALNESSESFTKIEYWPRVEFNVLLKPLVAISSIKVPPLPPGSAQTISIPFLVELRALPNDDPGFIGEIRLENEATGYRRTWREDEIDAIRFEESILLSKLKENRIILKVYPKNGLLREVSQTVKFAR